MPENVDNTIPTTEAPLFPANNLAYRIYMRQKFCPEEMLKPNGSLDPEYFKPKLQENLRCWNAENIELLIKGLEAFGIGHWEEICAKALPMMDPVEVKIRTMRLLGRQNMDEYNDRKVTAEEIKEIFAKNEAEGTKHPDRWQNNVLVDEL